MAKYATKAAECTGTLDRRLTPRADRTAHQREYAVAAGLRPDLDPGTTLVVTDWHYAGRGHPLADLLAADIASLSPRGGPPCPDSC